MEYKLVKWYEENKRDLPWRHSKDPYQIWISEIMLQQTRVETVIPYYHHFLEILPTIYDLAKASEETIYRLWQGLGYYSRVKNMQIAAISIVENYQGSFPDHYQELIKLKGIGNYTSRAISSIAFNEHVGAIDGNALRIFSRVFMIEENIQDPSTNKKIQQLADKMILNVDPGNFNQAMMDLGSSICTPKNPKCEICPIKQDCKSYITHATQNYPVNIKKVKIKKMNFIVGIIENQGKIILIKNKQGLLKNLYGNIQYETNSIEDYIINVERDHHLSITDPIYLGHVNHVFTHRIWELDVYHFTTHLEHDSLYKDYESLPISTCHLKVLELYKKGISSLVI